MGCNCKNRNRKLEEGLKAMRWFDKKSMPLHVRIWDWILSMISMFRIFPKMTILAIKRRRRDKHVAFKVSELINLDKIR